MSDKTTSDVRFRLEETESYQEGDKPDELSEYSPLCPSLVKAVDPDEKPIPMYRVLGYGLAGIGTSATSNLITVYFTIFLLETAKIHPMFVTMIMLVGKSINAISDPFVGYLVSQSPETRFGKFTPWMLVALPFVAILNFGIWFVPSDVHSVNVAYYFIVYCLMNVSRASFVIPYVSSVMAQSSQQSQRDKLVACRIFFDSIGTIIGMILQATWIYVGLLLDWERSTAYVFCAATCSVLLLIVGFLTFLSIEEKYTLNHGRGAWGPVFTPYFKVFRFRPYVLLLFSILFSYLGYQVAMSIYALYFKYVLNADKLFPLCTVITAMSGSISILAWKQLTPLIGKKTSITISLLLLMVVWWIHLYLKYNLTLIIVLSMLVGALSACCVIFVPASMLPDVIGAYSLKYGHGEEAMFYSITFFIETMSVALCSSFSSMVLEAAGYQSELSVQPQSVIAVLRCIIGVFAVLCFTVSLICLWEYPITEKKRLAMGHEIRHSMQSIRKV